MWKGNLLVLQTAKAYMLITRQEWEELGSPATDNTLKLTNMIRANPELYRKALQRGKYHKREEQSYNAVGRGKHATHRD